MWSKFSRPSSALLMNRAKALSLNGVIGNGPMVHIALSGASSSRTSPDLGNTTSHQLRTRRSLSFYAQSPPGDGKRGPLFGGSGGSSYSSPPLRAFPTYAVFGENCLLSIKMLPPMFRVHPNSNTLLLDSNKKGRILLEWTPRVANGRLSRDKESQLRFGLSAEEVGLMLDQLPSNIVEFSRRPATLTGQPEFGGNTTDVPDKVLRITPGEGGSVSFLIDHELNGVSVAPPASKVSGTAFSAVTSESSSTITTTGPLVVVAQLGEFIVIRELLRSSIPVLVGWNTMVEIAMQQRTLENMQNSSTSSHGGGGYGGGYGGEHTF